MIQPDNIVAFSAAAADILKELYRRFPSPMTINMDGVTEEILAATGILAPVADTLEWLHAEGYLRWGFIAPPLCSRVTLTSKGLSVMSSAMAYRAARDGVYPDVAQKIIIQFLIQPHD